MSKFYVEIVIKYSDDFPPTSLKVLQKEIGEIADSYIPKIKITSKRVK